MYRRSILNHPEMEAPQACNTITLFRFSPLYHLFFFQVLCNPFFPLLGTMQSHHYSFFVNLLSPCLGTMQPLISLWFRFYATQPFIFILGATSMYPTF